ncbi:MAG: type IX secretion system outer membrane channel protein PorV [bacterium]
MKRILVLVSFTGLIASVSFGQITTGELTGEINVIQSAVPFLTIAPDSRSGAMGDVGAATAPDINSQHWNPAKYVFMEGQGGAALSYTPWLRRLIPDINLAYLVGYKKLDGLQAVSASLRYFSLGNIVFTDIYGTAQGQFNPNEFAIDLGYSRLFSDNFSGAILFRFIRSDLTGGKYVGDVDSKAGTAVAADLAFYYTDEIDLGANDGRLSFGTDISNMGNKISYTETQEPAFLPINWRLGGNLDLEIDDYNSFSFALDLNKLLVPTPPIYSDSIDNLIIHGMDPNVSVPLGILQSFYDAPGVELSDDTRSVFREELHEITYSLGVEYWYRNQFAIRGGYFHEHRNKGNRKYFSLGVGLKLNVFELDFAYLIPTYQNNPLANTLRFTIGFDFDKYRAAN